MGMEGRWSGASRALLLTLAPLLVLCVDYHAGGQDFSFCIFKMLTGHPCYGCGTLRGLSAVLHGHPWEAVRLNPLNALTIPLLAWLYLAEWRRVLHRPMAAAVR